MLEVVSILEPSASRLLIGDKEGRRMQSKYYSEGDISLQDFSADRSDQVFHRALRYAVLKKKEVNDRKDFCS